ncbi:MAG: hypothetical protein IPM57_01240 [Oligoflexia bacterium]|nr:hypothetical protein [Oligoflexia bacterium]
MKNFKTSLFIILFLFSQLSYSATRRKSDYKESTEVPLSVTHILPSAFVIPGGTLVLGTTLGIGFFDVFDVSTNLYLDLYSVYNVAVKVGVYSSKDFAFAVHGGYVSQSVTSQSVDPSTLQIINTKSSVTSVEPGATLSYRIMPQFTGHIGGKAVIRNPVLTKQAFVPKTGFIQGNTVNKEFVLGINPELSLALGGSYDLTYDTPGAGLSLYLGSFQIGVHYYFGVTEGAAQPLLGGGYTARF